MSFDVDPKKFVSLPEVAHRLGLKYRVVMDAALEGHIRAVRIGRHWYVPVAEVERLTAERGEERSA